MHTIPSSTIPVLGDATPGQLQQAVAHNHRELFCLEAIAAGGEVKKRDGFIWTYGDAGHNAAVAFPSPAEGNTSAVLDEMMDYYRAHPPKGIGYWSLDPAHPEDTGIRLLARGFQPGWAPCWMALDLERIKDPHPGTAGLVVQEDNTTDIRDNSEIPYASDNKLATGAARLARPGCLQRFIASLDGKITGQSCVFLTTGDYGVAGIYNVGVSPRARHRGIGKALTLAACRYAKERGYRYAVLNASPEGRPIYEQTGFQWIGDGLTWWVVNNRYITHAPSAQQVAMAEATGRGDIASLDALGKQITTGDLNIPITNGMTWLELAAHFRQPASAEWLIAHGATCTAMDAWGLGWKDRAAALLAENPGEVNRQYGEEQLTMLHIAAQKNDIALAALALSAKPDLGIKDSMHDGIPLGWAEYFGRKEIARMIKEVS